MVGVFTSQNWEMLQTRVWLAFRRQVKQPTPIPRSGPVLAERPMGQEELFAEGANSHKAGEEQKNNSLCPWTWRPSRCRRNRQARRKEGRERGPTSASRGRRFQKTSSARCALNQAEPQVSGTQPLGRGNRDLDSNRLWFKSWLRCCICTHHLSSPGPGMSTGLRK